MRYPISSYILPKFLLFPSGPQHFVGKTKFPQKNGRRTLAPASTIPFRGAWNSPIRDPPWTGAHKSDLAAYFSKDAVTYLS